MNLRETVDTSLTNFVSLFIKMKLMPIIKTMLVEKHIKNRYFPQKISVVGCFKKVKG